MNQTKWNRIRHHNACNARLKDRAQREPDYDRAEKSLGEQSTGTWDHPRGALARPVTHNSLSVPPTGVFSLGD